MTFNIIASGDPGLASIAMQNWRHVNYGSHLIPVNSSGVSVNNTIDIGSSSYKFKDLWLSGNGYIAGSVGVGTASHQGLLTLYTAVDGTSVASNEMLTLWNNNSWGSTGINSIKWRDNNTGSGTVNGAIGLTYNAPTVDFIIHSLYNSGYKTESDISFIVKGNGSVGIGGTPSYLLDVNKSSSGSQVVGAIRNTSNTAASGAEFIVQVAGTAAGNPIVHWNIAGASNWYAGPDNSVSYNWRLSVNSDLSSPAISITTAGVVSITDLQAGEFALIEGSLTIASGAITIPATYGQFEVDTEGSSASDDLDTISGGNNNQIIILLAANDSHTVVIKHGTGNIYLNNSTDFSLDSTADSIMLQKRGSSWFMLSASNNA